MRIAIIGPTHPYKGGIAMHTTRLAHRLVEAGHEVELISWRTQYPFFYPGEQFVPHDKPELEPYPATRRVLSWKNPAGWGRWGRRLRGFDRIIFAWWVPTFQGPVYLGMLQALGRKRPPVITICHNVLPHEPRPGDRRLARAVLRRSDRVIVHSGTEAVVAGDLTHKPVINVGLPIPLPEIRKRPDGRTDPARQLLFFGFVRPYKGLDVLLRALAGVPDIKLTVAGEFWSDYEEYTQLVSKLGLEKRVTLRNGYVAADDLAGLITEADAVVLPYKEGTGSWNVKLAHAYGTPVIATTAGMLGDQVRDGVDGLLCEPGDTAALTEAIRRLYEPGVALRLRKGVPDVSADPDWNVYVEAVTGSMA